MEDVNNIEVKDFIEVTTTVSREVLENIFITAIEGGSNYWYYIPDREVEKIEECLNGVWGKSFSERLFETVYDKGIDVDIYDIENPDDKLGTLSRSTMRKRLSDCPSWALLNELQGNGDAMSSDVVFQCLVMGEVIFV